MSNVDKGRFKGFKVTPLLVKHLVYAEKSFGIEADIKSGSMLGPDRDKLNDIMTERLRGFSMLKSYGGVDNMLAFEKAYAEGSKDQVAIDRIDKIADSFSLIRDGEAYKAKVEGSDWYIDPNNLYIDDCRRHLADHLLGLHEKIRFAKRSDSIVSKEEVAVLSERYDIMDRVNSNYKSLQEQVLQPEKDAEQSKQAGAELAV